MDDDSKGDDCGGEINTKYGLEFARERERRTTMDG